MGFDEHLAVSATTMFCLFFSLKMTRRLKILLGMWALE